MSMNSQLVEHDVCSMVVYCMNADKVVNNQVDEQPDVSVNSYIEWGCK